MKQKILERIVGMYDIPIMQNNLRGLYAEVMVSQILGDQWRSVGGDWAAWDLEHHKTKKRIEIKQSAFLQTWGESAKAPRFSIKSAKFFWIDGIVKYKNETGERLADLYIFAWHSGDDEKYADHRVVEQWEFYAVREQDLPIQDTIGLSGIRKLSSVSTNSELKADAEKLL